MSSRTRFDIIWSNLIYFVSGFRRIFRNVLESAVICISWDDAVGNIEVRTERSGSYFDKGRCIAPHADWFYAIWPFVDGVPGVFSRRIKGLERENGC